MICQQNNILPADLPDRYAEQLGALVRVLEENERGRKKVFYRRVGSADDFAHPEVYGFVACEIWWQWADVERLSATYASTLDEYLDFPRSRLGDYNDEPIYSEGGPEPSLLDIRRM